jgi:hypothetical protein
MEWENEEDAISNCKGRPLEAVPKPSGFFCIKKVLSIFFIRFVDHFAI